MKQKLLLSLLFILTAMKALADFTVGGILYRSVGDYAVVATGVNGVTTGDITIPEVIAHEGQAYVVLGIAHGSFKDNTRITSLTINAPVTELAGSEFQGCTSLASVTLPATLKTIGSCAFYGSGLTSITIPASVDSIGRGVFTKCDALKTLKIEDNDIPLRFGNDFWNGTSGTDELCTSELNSFYMGRDIVTDVTDSRIVTSAKEIELAGFVTTVRNNFTRGDTLLQTLIVGGNAANIGTEAFHGCLRLTDVSITAAIDTIHQSAFEGCTALTAFAIPEMTKSIGSFAFYSTGLTSITIPASVDSIGRGVFTHCDALKTLKIEDKDIPLRFGNDYWNGPSGTEELCTSELNSFYMGRDIVTDVKDSRIVTSAKSIELVGYVSTVRNNFTRDDTLLQKLIVGGNAKDIGESAFQNCPRLTNVSIDASIDTIRFSAFDGCTALAAITIPATTKSIGTYAFYNTALTSFTIPASVDSIGRGVFTHCDALKTLTIEDNDKPLIFGNRYWNGTSGTDELCTSELNSFYMGRDIVTDVTDSPIVTSAKEIELAGFVTTVRNNFTRGDTLLQTLIVGGNAANIGTEAFHGCLRLTDVSITAAIDTIHQSAFEGCTALTAFSIPETTTSIGSYAFYNTALTSFTIPASVDSIGRGVFTHCDALKTLTIEDNDKPLIFGNRYWNGTNGTDELCTSELNSFYMGRDIVTDVTDSRIVTSAKKIELAGFVTTVRNNFTRGDTLLQTLIVGGNAANIGTKAFHGCLRLTDVSITTAIDTIHQSAFEGCTALTAFAIPETTKSIGSYAFYSTGLTSVTIPASVDSIGRGVFTHCDALKTFRIEDADTPLLFGNNFWNGTSGTDELCTTPLDELYVGRPVKMDHINSIAKETKVLTLGESFAGSDHVSQNFNGLFSKLIVTDAVNVPWFAPMFIEASTFAKVTYDQAYLFVPSAESVEAYSRQPSWSLFLHIAQGTYEQEEEVIILLDNVASFSSERDLDFSGSDLKAYVCTGIERKTNRVVMTRVNDVAAGTGLLLVGTPGIAYKVPCTPHSSTYDNLLQANIAESVIEPTSVNGRVNYIFDESTTDASAPSSRMEATVCDKGFLAIEAPVTLPGKKAYLQLPSIIAMSDTSIGVVLNDEVVTGSPLLTSPEEEELIYNLAGQRLSKKQKGINIVGGRKVMVK